MAKLIIKVSGRTKTGKSKLLAKLALEELKKDKWTSIELIEELNSTLYGVEPKIICQVEE